MRPDAHGYNNNSLKFVTDGQAEEDDGENVARKTSYGSGLVRHDHLVYYPLLIYNNYLPDNSELVIVNMAEKDNTSQAVKLGKWRFIAFV